MPASVSPLAKQREGALPRRSLEAQLSGNACTSILRTLVTAAENSHVLIPGSRIPGPGCGKKHLCGWTYVNNLKRQGRAWGIWVGLKCNHACPCEREAEGDLRPEKPHQGQLGGAELSALKTEEGLGRWQLLEAGRGKGKEALPAPLEVANFCSAKLTSNF